MRNSNSTISKGIDWSLVWIYLALVLIGLSAIFAATYTEGDPVLQSFIAFKTDYSKQFYFFGIALMVGFFILLTDSKFFPATANIWYVIGILLLILVFPFHSRIKGTESIIRIGAFNFQPAWRNWQTRRTQNPFPARECGFDPLRRQNFTGHRPPGSGRSRFPCCLFLTRKMPATLV